MVGAGGALGRTDGVGLVAEELSVPFGQTKLPRHARAPEFAAPLEPSIRSTAYGPVNQLRDPAIYVEGGRVFLLYAVAGESGIALAEVVLDRALAATLPTANSRPSHQ